MKKGKNIMRFICFYLFLVVLAFEGNVLAQTLQAPQATIQSRIYIPSDAEFQKMTAEEQRAFQSAGLMLHLSVKKEPAVAKTENKVQHVVHNPEPKKTESQQKDNKK